MIQPEGWVSSYELNRLLFWELTPKSQINKLPLKWKDKSLPKVWPQELVYIYTY